MSFQALYFYFYKYLFENQCLMASVQTVTSATSSMDVFNKQSKDLQTCKF